jgi:hypothetical protein
MSLFRDMQRCFITSANYNSDVKISLTSLFAEVI